MRKPSPVGGAAVEEKHTIGMTDRACVFVGLEFAGEGWVAPLGIEPRCSVEKLVFARPPVSTIVRQSLIFPDSLSAVVHQNPTKYMRVGVKTEGGAGGGG